MSNSVTFRTKTYLMLGILSAALITANEALADCPPEQYDVVLRMVQDAENLSDDFDRLVLIKRSIKVCAEYRAWIELGRLQLKLENTSEAVNAFERARDFQTPSATGSLNENETRRFALGSGWLAEAYLSDGDLALASVAAQEARRGFNALNRAVPSRLMRLQAEIDDAMSKADSSVLARSFKVQHDRATRGIGVRPINNTPEPAEVVAETDKIEAIYSGSEAVTGHAEVAAIPSLADSAAASNAIESKLNLPVLFGFDSGDISADSENTIVQLSAAIDALELRHPSRVLVIGHTDAQGSASYNQALSLLRAQNVLAKIRSMVKSNPQFEARGRGESDLRYFGTTSGDHRRNRRVEIIVRR